MQDENAIKAATFARLQNEIKGIEGFRLERAAGVTIGLPSLERAFSQNCIPTGVIHEFVCADQCSAASSAAFLFAFLSRFSIPNRKIVWISKEPQLFPHGVKRFGFNPDNIIFIRRQKEQEILWSMEAALQTQGLGGVISEVTTADLTATRRLQRVVEKTGVTGFLMRNTHKTEFSSAAHARWLIEGLASEAPSGLSGLGYPRWKINLLKAKNGRPALVSAEWKYNQFFPVESLRKPERQSYHAQAV